MIDINGCESEVIFNVYFRDGAIEEHCPECASNWLRDDYHVILKIELNTELSKIEVD